MSEQAQRVRNKTIPEGANGLYYAKGNASEVLVYRDDEALYFEHRGQNSAVVRFSFEMLETLKTVIEEEEHSTQ
jgi:hypothetical protein